MVVAAVAAAGAEATAADVVEAVAAAGDAAVAEGEAPLAGLRLVPQARRAQK